jgi:hypothetical protein
LVVKNLMAEKLWENGTVDRSLFIHVYVTWWTFITTDIFLPYQPYKCHDIIMWIAKERTEFLGLLI